MQHLVGSFDIRLRIFIFKYSITNCGDCIDAELTLLSDFQKQNKFSIPIVLLAYYSDFSNLLDDMRMINSLELEAKLFLMANDVLFEEIDSNHVPYYFLLDKDLEANNTFIPKKECPDLNTLI